MFEKDPCGVVFWIGLHAFQGLRWTREAHRAGRQDLLSASKRSLDQLHPGTHQLENIARPCLRQIFSIVIGAIVSKIARVGVPDSIRGTSS